MTNPSPEQLMTADEAAALLGVDRSTVTRWAQSGRLEEHMKFPGLRGPRLFERSTVEALAGERKQA